MAESTPQPVLRFDIIIVQKNGDGPLIFEDVTSVEVNKYSKTIRIRQAGKEASWVQMSNVAKMGGVGEWEQPTA